MPLNSSYFSETLAAIQQCPSDTNECCIFYNWIIHAHSREEYSLLMLYLYYWFMSQEDHILAFSFQGEFTMAVVRKNDHFACLLTRSDIMSIRQSKQSTLQCSSFSADSLFSIHILEMFCFLVFTNQQWHLKL